MTGNPPRNPHESSIRNGQLFIYREEIKVKTLPKLRFYGHFRKTHIMHLNKNKYTKNTGDVTIDWIITGSPLPGQCATPGQL